MAVNFKVANLVFGGSRFFLQYPSLLYNANKGMAYAKGERELHVDGQSFVDFTTYFNSLSVMKWKKYTVAQHFRLHLEHRGACVRFEQRMAGNFDWESVMVPDSSFELPASDVWVAYDVDLDCDLDQVLHGFSLEADNAYELRNAYYYAVVEDTAVRNVELAVATTTFKKESYILKNIESIKKGIIESEETISGHFNLYVVDNGRTLRANELNGDHVTVYPNPNVGGSGGFARGMIEAMEHSPKATHVLLMDDDVEVMPESFIRAFNLLSLVKTKYVEAFISGAMMSLEEPDVRTEDIGYFNYIGNFGPLKPAGRMSLLHDVVETEIYKAPIDLHPDTKYQYAGWWFCVVPMSVIEEYGLPLPLFVRSDDAEYSLRCNAKLISMNGICVWHNAFQYKYSSAVERYQVSRNTLICQATTGIAPETNFLREIHHEVQLDLKKFNYDDAELAVKGLEDFLRGPDFIAHPVAESRFMAANREKEKLMPLDEIKKIALERYGIDLSYLTWGNLNNTGTRSWIERAQDYLLFNGQRSGSSQGVEQDKVAVIDAAGWVYPSGKLHGVNVIIAIDMYNKKGVIRHLDKKRFKEVWTRYKNAVRTYNKRSKALKAEYASRRDEFTSVEFWRRYLDEAAKN